ncbi:MAG: cytochrome c3 family protein [Syntrophales bacterium]
MRKRVSVSLLSMAALILFALLLADNSKCSAASKPAQDKKNPNTAQTDANKPFSKDTNCAACHESYVDSMKNDKMLMSKHAVMTKDCFFCHKEAQLVTAHEKVTKAPGKVFRQRKYPNDICLTCHGTYDSLVEKTKNSTAFKTVDNKLINPHDTHVGRVECFNCHKMHKDRPPIEYCYGCHHARQLNNCKDCHSPKKE